MGICVGVFGLILGTAAAIWDVVTLAVLAGALALVAGVIVFRLVGRLRNANEEIEELAGKVSELETTVEQTLVTLSGRN